MQDTTPRPMFYKLAKELCGKDGIEALDEAEKRQIAQRLLYMCFPMGSSNGINGKATHGFGNLDDNGFWEFPLTTYDIRKMKAGTL